jgi:DNA-binding response OmpR family regulator
MGRRRKILLVDDDAALRGSLAEQLAPEYDTAEVDSGAAALAAAKADRFDAIVLDIGLPDLDGREVCRQLRAGGINVPVIMLTASAGESDTIAGLDAGANDYTTM